ncbi:YraN family protein [Rhizobium sp. CAU 1783]
MSRFATPDKRKRAERRGRWSEWGAALFLMAKGYRILAMRYRVRAGEIDIIARRGELVAFIEVKARRNAMAAIDAVTVTSQRRIRAASDYWLARQPDVARLSLRYDIVAVMPWTLPRHFEGAF